MFSSPILLIDDEPVINDLYRRMLEGRGYNVVAVANGHDALDVIHADLPELVISDVLMPGMSGHDLCARLTRAGEKRMPFLFLTANDDYASMRDGLASGGDDFLVKGMDMGVILERVRFWLRTPFDGLPAAPRAAAAALCEDAGRDPNAVHGKPIAGLGMMREDIREKAIARVRRSLDAAGTNYVDRDDVPLSLLGYITGVIDILTEGDLPGLMRYADYFDAVVGDLAPRWAVRARPMLADFETLSAGELFTAARHKGVQDTRRHTR
ncbi:MAG: response regulator [Sphingomonadales bacterium]